MVKNDIHTLLYKFKEIKKMGWVENKRSGTTGIGYTFESLLNKPEENFEIPDFGKIEIKTKHKFSKGFLTLFNATPDGDELFSIKKIYQNYGYPDKTCYTTKVFKGSVNCKTKNFIGLYYQFQLKIDYESKKIILLVFDNNDNIIDNSISWSFNMLENKLNRKLQYLALIKAETKRINNKEFFNYYFIKFYKLKSFDYFIKLLEDNDIRVTFKIGTFKKGKRKGQIHDHGTGFDINEKDIKNMYIEIIPREII